MNKMKFLLLGIALLAYAAVAALVVFALVDCIGLLAEHGTRWTAKIGVIACGVILYFIIWRSDKVTNWITDLVIGERE